MRKTTASGSTETRWPQEVRTDEAHRKSTECARLGDVTATSEPTCPTWCTEESSGHRHPGPGHRSTHSTSDLQPGESVPRVLIQTVQVRSLERLAKTGKKRGHLGSCLCRVVSCREARASRKGEEERSFHGSLLPCPQSVGLRGGRSLPNGDCRDQAKPLLPRRPLNTAGPCHPTPEGQGA